MVSLTTCPRASNSARFVSWSTAASSRSRRSSGSRAATSAAAAAAPSPLGGDGHQLVERRLRHRGARPPPPSRASPDVRRRATPDRRCAIRRPATGHGPRRWRLARSRRSESRSISRTASAWRRRLIENGTCVRVTSTIRSCGGAPRTSDSIIRIGPSAPSRRSMSSITIVSGWRRLAARASAIRAPNCSARSTGSAPTPGPADAPKAIASSAGISGQPDPELADQASGELEAVALVPTRQPHPREIVGPRSHSRRLAAPGRGRHDGERSGRRARFAHHPGLAVAVAG